ncbi:AMP-binding protein [Streptomyces sp. BPSDS2]|uniref:AMP-binding protein n=1 Tax=Streptomyces sp. BPSDS2 TaxID=2571021 RepID=UPI0010C16D23|nr:AMP-binding protein [Streptomyces sp. BPSDS2]
MRSTGTVAELVRRQWGDHRPALKHGPTVLSHHQVVEGAAARAALLADLLPRGGEPHLGVLLDNTPEFPLWLSAAALAGAAVAGINPTRRGPELARDILHTEAPVLITERAHLPLLADLELPGVRVVVTGTEAYAAVLAPYAGARPGDAVLAPVGPDSRMLLYFTSGSTGAPKAAICTQGRLAGAGASLAGHFGVRPSDTHYICMPMFHGNAVLADWAPALAAGAAIALRPRFSASAFLDDVRAYGATYFTYVGRAVQYLLATPERPDDRDHPLRLGFGTEAGAVDAARFRERFGVRLVEGYGSSEGGAAIQHTPGTPAGAIGRAAPGDDLAVVDPESGAERARRGWYWTGDLFYRDADGFLYFAGRTDDRLRVDSENLAAATIENILARWEEATATAVYAVPDPVTGDQVMAALTLRAGAAFDPAAFTAFLRAQPDLGTKMAPRFVRILDRMPVTATNKIHRVALRRAGFRCPDPVWWDRDGDGAYVPLDAEGIAALLERYEEHGRAV